MHVGRPLSVAMMSPAPRRLAIAASVMLGAVLPMLMVIANKSAPVSLGAAAILSTLSAWLAGFAPTLRRRYITLMTSQTTAVIAAFVVLCVCSLGWSIDPALTRRGLVEALPELIFSLMVATAWPLVAQRRDARWLIVGIIGASALIVLERSTGMPLHALIRARGEIWDLKRSAIPPLLLLWPAVAFCVGGNRVDLDHDIFGWTPFKDMNVIDSNMIEHDVVRKPVPTLRHHALALALIAATTLGIIVAHSGAPGLALFMAGTLGLVARALPKVALAVAGTLLVGLIVLAPWTGTLADRLISPGAESLLAEEHAAHRMRIWSAFEDRVSDRWVIGHGFDASFKVSQAPRPPGRAPDADAVDMLNNHPHNVFLELWVELGLAGAVAALGGGVFVLVRLAALEARVLAPRLALLISIIGVGLVGLSAWQPWWLATIAASLLWFDLLATRSDA